MNNSSKINFKDKNGIQNTIEFYCIKKDVNGKEFLCIDDEISYGQKLMVVSLLSSEGSQG